MTDSTDDEIATPTPSAPAPPSAPPSAPAPVATGQRHDSLDVLRGFALLGILLMNITAFGAGFIPYFAPGSFGNWDQTGRMVWAVNHIMSDGTMRALFALLFGAGVILLTERLEARGLGSRVADIYYRRTTWLMIFGMIDAYLLVWGGDILFLYGFSALFLFLFRNVRAKRLMVLGLSLFVLLSLLQGAGGAFMGKQYSKYQEALSLQDQGEELSEDQAEMLDADNFMLTPADPQSEKRTAEIEGRLGGYGDNLSFNADYANDFAVQGVIPFGLIDGIWFMFIGMAFYKYGILTLEKSTRFYAAMVLIGLPVGIALRLPFTLDILESNFDQLVVLKSMVMYHPGRLFISMGYLGLIMLIVKWGILKWITAPLASVGRMAFTNYILQNVLGGIIFYGYGFALFNQLRWHELYYVMGGMWLFSLIFSHLWLKVFRYGPLEWLWRSCTYAKWQKLRI